MPSGQLAIGISIGIEDVELETFRCFILEQDAGKSKSQTYLVLYTYTFRIYVLSTHSCVSARHFDPYLPACLSIWLSHPPFFLLLFFLLPPPLSPNRLVTIKFPFLCLLILIRVFVASVGPIPPRLVPSVPFHSLLVSVSVQPLFLAHLTCSPPCLWCEFFSFLLYSFLF